MIEVPGDMLEGGGQILRMSVAISAAAKKPIRVVNIRAKRKPPGLRPQHLTAIKSVASLSGAKVEGLSVGSMSIEFTPSTPRGGDFRFDVGTAGSTTLILQALIPAALYAQKPTTIEIRGGTNNPWAPPIDYLNLVMLPALSRMGVNASVSLLRRGFYPRGGGVIRARINPVKSLKPIKLVEGGGVKRVFGLSYSCRLPDHIARRMASAASKLIESAGYPEPEIELEVLQPNHPKCSPDPGCGIVLVAELENGALLGADALGEKGKPAERVGEEAAQLLVEQLETGAAVDKHMGDQLIVYMSLAKGRSEIRVSELTLHTLTCIELSKLLLGVEFEVDGEEGGPVTISCEGVGLENPQ